MPCSDGRDNVSDEQTHFWRNLSEKQCEEVKRLEKRCNELTNLLCATGRALISKKPFSEDVLKYMSEHAAADALKGEPWL